MSMILVRQININHEKRQTTKLPGAVFNQTTLALDAALTEQMVSITCTGMVY